VMCRLQEAEYSPEPQAVPQARQWLTRLLAHWGVTDSTDAARLLLTELVTNALVHAQSQVRVTASIADGMLEVGVADLAPPTHLHGLPDSVPAPRSDVPVSRLPEGGRGLALLTHIAEAWGVTELGRGKQIWFRLPVSRSWAHRSECPCPNESPHRIRLDSGRFAVAVAGPWDQPRDDVCTPLS
jgi:anti-sigma regulatory factor (Ser/Thr protein kinase)